MAQVHGLGAVNDSPTERLSWVHASWIQWGPTVSHYHIKIRSVAELARQCHC